MTNMTIYAKALSDNRNYKNARIDGKTVGVAESRAWHNAVKAMLIPAYAVAKYHHDNMGSNRVEDNSELSALMTPLFNALHPVLDLIGEVNGAKLFAENCAPMVWAVAHKIVAKDLTVEMSDARANLKLANQVLENGMDSMIVVSLDEKRAEFIQRLTAAAQDEETLTAFVEDCKETVKRMESEPNNCRKDFDINGDNPFIKAVEIAFGDAINAQKMRSVDDILAEVEARRQARRAKTATKKAAKKSAK